MINEKRLLETFMNLVRIDSPTSFEENISKFVVDLFKNRSIKSSRDELNNVIVNIPGIGLPLLLSAHLDTVEPGRGINPVVENGKIKSDGKTILGVDNKVAVAGIIEAVTVIVKNKLNSRPLNIIFTVSEETGSYGVLGLDFSEISAKEGYIFDMSKKIGTVITASPFYDRFDIEIIGKSSHASLPEKGINAANILKDALFSIKLGRVSENTLVNIGFLQGGDARNTVPGLVKLNGEVRSFSKKEQDQNLEKIETIFRDASKKYSGRLRFRRVRENMGYAYKSSEGLIINAITNMKKVKIKPILVKAYGCSDANVFLEKGIRVLNLGNGSRNAHTTREEIDVKDLTTLSKLILSLSTN